MGWTGAGGYTRQHNFSADASADIKILATRMDQEFDDVGSAMTNALARDGQNTPVSTLPMGGNRHVNVGAATSANNYLRVSEFITQTPIYMVESDGTRGDNSRISVSAAFFTTVSAAQAPVDGTRIVVRTGSGAVGHVSGSAFLALNTPTGTHEGTIYHQDGTLTHTRSILDSRIYEFTWNSAINGWQMFGNEPHFAQINDIAASTVVALNAAGTTAGTAAITPTAMRDGDNIYFGFDQASVSCSISASELVITNPFPAEDWATSGDSFLHDFVPLYLSDAPHMYEVEILVSGAGGFAEVRYRQTQVVAGQATISVDTAVRIPNHSVRFMKYVD